MSALDANKLDMVAFELKYAMDCIADPMLHTRRVIDAAFSRSGSVSNAMTTSSTANTEKTLSVDDINNLMAAMTKGPTLDPTKPSGVRPGDTFWFNGKEYVVLSLDLNGLNFAEKAVVDPSFNKWNNPIKDPTNAT